ncbi:NUDIX domain-containing protein [bacterium]|nr:NUDIX domain-containing protein [bacterium]
MFDIYQREQLLYNGTMTTFELAQKQDSVLILAVQDNKIIVTQEENPSSVSTNRRLPGGRMDPGETDPLLSAKRELLEET